VFTVRGHAGINRFRFKGQDYKRRAQLPLFVSRAGLSRLGFLFRRVVESWAELPLQALGLPPSAPHEKQHDDYEDHDDEDGNSDRDRDSEHRVLSSLQRRALIQESTAFRQSNR
jgi:hypothetical protein